MVKNSFAEVTLAIETWRRAHGEEEQWWVMGIISYPYLYPFSYYFNISFN